MPKSQRNLFIATSTAILLCELYTLYNYLAVEMCLFVNVSNIIWLAVLSYRKLGDPSMLLRLLVLLFVHMKLVIYFVFPVEGSNGIDLVMAVEMFVAAFDVLLNLPDEKNERVAKEEEEEEEEEQVV